MPQPPSGARGRLGRSWRLWGAFRHEQDDPAATYAHLADDTADLVARHRDLDGLVALDVGGGPGYTAEALRRRGAVAFTLDPSRAELELHHRRPDRAVVGDGRRLPVRSDSVDLVCTLNALEHVPEPWGLLAELLRIARPGGLVFVGFTNWLSPWGGHETSPWHYLGGERAARRYQARHGRPPKNRFGTTLFRLGVGDVLRWAEAEPGVVLLDAFPRYAPDWWRPVLRVPGLREVVTWNLAVVLEKT